MNAQFDPIQDSVKVVETTTVQSESTTDQKVRVEEFKFSRDTLFTILKGLTHKGKMRRLVVKNKQDETLVEAPLLAVILGGIFSAAVFPVATVLAAIGVLAANLGLVVERQEE